MPDIFLSYSREDQATARHFADVFAIQDEIAHTVAEQLRLKLDVQDLNAGGTRNVAAWDEFLAARSLLNSHDASMVTAVPRLERALELDSKFMTARLWLIDAYMRKSLGDAAQRDTAILQEERAIDQVVRQSPNTPEASFALSYRAARGRDLAELERLMQDAMRIPGYMGERARVRFGQFLMGVGRFKAALPVLEAVLRNDPLDGFSRVQVLLAVIGTGDLERAEREIEQSLRTPGIDPATMYQLHISIADTQRDDAKARRIVQSAIDAHAISKDQGLQLLQLRDEPVVALRALHERADNPQLQGDVYFASGIAQDAAFLGDRKLALRALGAMTESKFSFDTVAWILWKFELRDLRGEPAFRQIVRELGLKDYWRKTGNWGDFCNPAGADDFECH